MITMKGKMITLEPLDIQKHAKGYLSKLDDKKHWMESLKKEVDS